MSPISRRMTPGHAQIGRVQCFQARRRLPGRGRGQQGPRFERSGGTNGRGAGRLCLSGSRPTSTATRRVTEVHTARQRPPPQRPRATSSAPDARQPGRADLRGKASSRPWRTLGAVTGNYQRKLVHAVGETVSALRLTATATNGDSRPGCLSCAPWCRALRRAQELLPRGWTRWWFGTDVKPPS